MMTCRKFIEFLMAYLDNEIPQNQRTTFDRHIRRCPACRRYLETYQQTVKLGRGAYKPDAPVPAEVPDDLVTAVLAARRSA